MQPKDTQTKKSAAEYLKEPYGRVLIPEEDGGYSAELLEFPGCVSQGDSADEALSNLELAATNWIEETINQGHPIPPPSVSYGYSGKVALRLPRSVHRKAVEMAERDGVSLNTFLVSAIAARVGQRDLRADLVNQFKALISEMEARLIKQTVKNSQEWAVSLVKAWEQPATNEIRETASNADETTNLIIKRVETLEVREKHGRS